MAAAERNGPSLSFRTVARRLLDTRLDALTDRLVRLIRETVEDYREAVDVSDADLRTSCRDNLRQALRELGGDVRPDRQTPAPQQLTGVRRAQQDVPLEGLLHAYRLGGRVLWQGLVNAARSEPATDLAQLLEEATAVWETIDRHSAIVATAYRGEQARLEHQRQRRRQALLAALVDGAGTDAEVARSASAALGMPTEGAKMLVVGAYQPPLREPLRAPDEALAVRGLSSVWHVRAGREIGLVSLAGHDDEAAAVAVLVSCAAGPVAVAPPVSGLDQLPLAYQLADAALRALPPGTIGVVRATDRLPEAILASNPDFAGLLVRDTLGDVLRLPAAERAALLDTLAALVACDNSPTHAADRLYCHRNTVIKRQQRLEQLTGRRLTDAQDRLRLHLALIALGLSPGER